MIMGPIDRTRSRRGHARRFLAWPMALVITVTFAAADPAVPAPEPPYPRVAVGGATRLTLGGHDAPPDFEATLGPLDSGLTFRTARLWAKGHLAEGIGFQTEMDFGQPGRPSFQNAYLELQGLGHPFGTLRLGRWKQPFSLETMTSIRFLTFLERATLFTLVPFRRTGAGFFDVSDDQQSTWAFSVMRGGDDNFGNDVSDEDGTGAALRLTHLLEDQPERDRLIHAGATYHVNDPGTGTMRFATPPELVIGSATRGNIPSFSDTGALATDLYHLIGFELAIQRGRTSFQGELARAHVDRPGAPGVDLEASYIFVSHFLRGGKRTYSRAAGAFDRPEIDTPFRPDKPGGGAWELAARLSRIDLEDEEVTGGRLSSATLGVNWHLARNTKLILNHIWSTLDRAGTISTSATGLQMAYDF